MKREPVRKMQYPCGCRYCKFRGVKRMAAKRVRQLLKREADSA